MKESNLQPISNDAQEILRNALMESLEPAITNISKKVGQELSRVTYEYKTTLENISNQIDKGTKEFWRKIDKTVANFTELVKQLVKLDSLYNKISIELNKCKKVADMREYIIDELPNLAKSIGISINDKDLNEILLDSIRASKHWYGTIPFQFRNVLLMKLDEVLLKEKLELFDVKNPK